MKSLWSKTISWSMAVFMSEAKSSPLVKIVKLWKMLLFMPREFYFVLLWPSLPLIHYYCPRYKTTSSEPGRHCMTTEVRLLSSSSPFCPESSNLPSLHVCGSWMSKKVHSAKVFINHYCSWLLGVSHHAVPWTREANWLLELYTWRWFSLIPQIDTEVWVGL